MNLEERARLFAEQLKEQGKTLEDYRRDVRVGAVNMFTAGATSLFSSLLLKFMIHVYEHHDKIFSEAKSVVDFTTNTGIFIGTYFLAEALIGLIKQERNLPIFYGLLEHSHLDTFFSIRAPPKTSNLARYMS